MEQDCRPMLSPLPCFSFQNASSSSRTHVRAVIIKCRYLRTEGFTLINMSLVETDDCDYSGFTISRCNGDVLKSTSNCVGCAFYFGEHFQVIASFHHIFGTLLETLSCLIPIKHCLSDLCTKITVTAVLNSPSRNSGPDYL